MVKYRVFPAGMDGRFIGFEPLFCESDDEAVAKAERLADGHTLNFGAGRVWWRGSFNLERFHGMKAAFPRGATAAFRSGGSKDRDPE
jgi:hypothetical protein